MNSKIAICGALISLPACGQSNEKGEEQAYAVEAPGNPQAFSCIGTSQSVMIDKNGRILTNDREVKRDYIVDDQRRTIFASSDALEDRQSSNFCDLEANCEVEVTPSLIIGQVDGDAGGLFQKREKRITFDRNTGDVLDVMRIHYKDGREQGYNRNLQCTEFEVPVEYRKSIGPPKF